MATDQTDSGPTPDGGDATEGASSGGTEGQTSGAPASESAGGTRTFSQDEVNALVTREVDKAKRGKLDPKELGFESGKDMKDYIDKAKELIEEQRSDQEKAIEAARQEGAQAVRDELLPTVNERVLRAEFLLAAIEHKVSLPDDAFVLAKTLKAWEDVAIDEQGVVTGLDKGFFDALKAEKPFLFGATTETPTPPGDIGAGAQGGTGGNSGPVDPARRAELESRYGVLQRLGEAIRPAQPSQQG